MSKVYRVAAYPRSQGNFRPVVLVSDDGDPGYVRERAVPGMGCATMEIAAKAAAEYVEVLREANVSFISPRRRLLLEDRPRVATNGCE
ncbi:hypothetical protein [Noviluteimonas dokdonensis]|nr:hypothetical protein [Lysobacter dokdonensis]